MGARLAGCTGLTRSHRFCRVLVKMQAYMETFKRFEERSQLDELETIFESFTQIAFFEKSQLSTPPSINTCAFVL